MIAADLWVREVGRGSPLVILHGGPDFDTGYLLPEMDQVADGGRLIYYDQRGRGRSTPEADPEQITLASEMEDLDRVRARAGERTALLGHSFGALLALEYAARHPARVSRLILMNAAPVSHADFELLRAERRSRWPDDVAELERLRAAPGWRDGDPDAVAASYRVHFRRGLARAEDGERLVDRLRAGFTREGILRARRIEDRLVAETWLAPGYDLLPRLGAVDVPALVLHGEHDFIPEACARHLADALPRGRLVVLPDCGHFAYLEQPRLAREAILAVAQGA